MEYSPPPFFKQGPSARARLLFFATLSIVMLLGDARFKTLTIVRQTIGTALYPIQRVALVPREVFRGGFGYFADQAALRRENEQLKAAQLANAQTVQQVDQLAAENSRLRKLLDARERVTRTSVLATLLYDARDPFSRKVVIDRGTRTGVSLGAPAIDDKGVVGQVVRVFPFTAEVALVTDRDQALPVQVVRNGLRAIAYGGQTAGTLEVRFLAANADIQPGDKLVTSGLDGVYPAGLAVATVTSVDRTQANQFARVVCAPAAGVNQHAHVLVLQPDPSFPPPPPPAEPETPVKGKARKGPAP